MISSRGEGMGVGEKRFFFSSMGVDPKTQFEETAREITYKMFLNNKKRKENVRSHVYNEPKHCKLLSFIFKLWDSIFLLISVC